MKHTTTKAIPKATVRTIRCTPGASSEIARRSGCARSTVSMALSGRRRCNEAIWEAVAEWLAEPRHSDLRAMAYEEMKHAS